jgi:hypothetical protein
MAQPGIPRRFRPLLQQAQAEANVRFGGERSGLLALIAAAQDTYRKSVQQAHSAAAILGAATQQAQNTLADPSNPITSLAVKAQAMPGTEGAIVAQNLGLTANSARSLIAEQGVNAAAAQKYQGQQALGQYRSDLGKVQGQQQDLASRYGDYITGRYDSLVGADRKQRHDANLAAKDLAAGFAKAGVNPDGTIIKGGPKDPAVVRAGRAPRAAKAPKPGKPMAAPGVPLLSPKDHNTARTGIDNALAVVRQVAGTDKKVGRQQLYQSLVAGRDAITGTDPGTGKTVHVPARKALPSLYVRAALDLYYYGYVTQPTVKALNRAGYRVRELGYKLPPNPSLQRPPTAAGPGGSGQRPT